MTASFPVRAEDGRHLGSVFLLITGWNWAARLADGRYQGGTAQTHEQAENAVRVAHETARKGGASCRS